MSSPDKPSLESTPNKSLPDELLLRIFARVSRLYYPTLSLVSYSFRSLLTSRLLYRTRSSLGNTESCLYVCLKFPPDPNPRWFTLCLKPNPTLINDTEKNKEKKKNSGDGYVLAKIPIRNSPPAQWSGLVALGSDIYNIGGCTDESSPSSNVSFLDCWSHSWKMAPDMCMERYYPSANVVDGKIYVAGGCKGCDTSNWMEVFDPKTQSWELVSCPMKEMCGCDIGISAGMNGKVYTFGNTFRKFKGLAYETKKDTWQDAVWEMDIDSYTVIENVLYYYSSGEFKWLDTKKKIRRKGKLTGLEGLPKFASYACVKLTDYGGKMAVFWDEFVPSSGYNEKMIWCAVIALERLDGGALIKMCGTVEWCDVVLTVPKSYEFEYALSVTV